MVKLTVRDINRSKDIQGLDLSLRGALYVIEERCILDIERAIEAHLGTVAEASYRELILV